MVSPLRLTRQVTTRDVSRPNIVELWVLPLRQIPRVRAALSESAAVRPTRRRRHGPWNHIEPVLVVTDVWHRVHQSLGVRMMRPREQLTYRRLFDDLSRVHHNDTRCRLGDDTEVVGDH